MTATILVAPSTEQAQLYAASHGALLGIRVITTDRRAVPAGLLPLAADVLLLPGWHLGRHAEYVENCLRRALAKRRQRFEDVREAVPA